MEGRENAGRPFWFDGDGGFSTVGVAIALLIALSLVFSGAQVYRVQTASAEVQEVADAAALAADNAVANYYLVARVCDAMVLSLSLAGVIVTGMGVAALCAPPSAALGAKLIDAGRKILHAREKFAQKAASGLDKLQRALPFLGALNASRVAAANTGTYGTPYFGLALAVPAEGRAVSAGTLGGADSLMDAVGDAQGDLERAGNEAERAAREARAAKERAYEADCGAEPSRCMRERARVLCGLEGAENPSFGSASTWGFSVALQRARAYYAKRIAVERPEGASSEEQADSALRKRFYRYAVDELAKGWVRESDDSFDASFPLLPRNTSEMRETVLYSEAVYPVTEDASGTFQMHAWPGCPRAAGSVRLDSIASMEAGGFSTCPECRFEPSSMGKVAAASSSIDNGFEYHYRIVVDAARDYEKAMDEYEPKADKARGIAEKLFGEAVEALRTMAGQRIEVAPPGRFGMVAIAVSGEPLSTQGAFPSGFIDWTGELGTRVAISGATLVGDSPEQGRTTIASALDGLSSRVDSPFVGALGVALDAWSAVLYAYADGQERIGEGIDRIAEKVPKGSESRLEVWSSKRFSQLMESVGLQPAELDAPKPVLVNTAHALAADDGELSVRLLSVKRAASTLTGDNPLVGAVDAAERKGLEVAERLGREFVVAEVSIGGEGSPSVPVKVTLPGSVRDGAVERVTAAAERLRGIALEITGMRQWR